MAITLITLTGTGGNSGARSLYILNDSSNQMLQGPNVLPFLYLEQSLLYCRSWLPGLSVRTNFQFVRLGQPVVRPVCVRAYECVLVYLSLVCTTYHNPSTEWHGLHLIHRDDPRGLYCETRPIGTRPWVCERFGYPMALTDVLMFLR